MHGQHPELPVAAAAPDTDAWQQLLLLGWIDRTALAVLLVFALIGLFQGAIWQLSRLGILLVAYAVAGRYGHQFGDWLAGDWLAGDRLVGDGRVGGALAATAGELAPASTTIYAAYVLVFLAVLVGLSLLANSLQRAAHRAGLGFFDRLAGSLCGAAAGAGFVLFGLFVVQMFFHGSQLAAASVESHAMRCSQRAIEWLGPQVPDELRTAIRLSPLRSESVPPPLLPQDAGGSQTGVDNAGVGPGAGHAPANSAPANSAPANSAPAAPNLPGHLPMPRRD